MGCQKVLSLAYVHGPAEVKQGKCCAFLALTDFFKCPFVVRFFPIFSALCFGFVISLFKVASKECAKVLLSVPEPKKTNALWRK